MSIPPEDEPAEEILVTTASLAGMATSNDRDEPVVYDLTGPQQAYFELPLDWHVSAEGELTPAEALGAVRLIQRVHYKSFRLVGPDADQVCERGMAVIAAVRTELKKAADVSFIWWRLHPKYQIEDLTPEDVKKGRHARHSVRLRLGTLPSLPPRFWLDLSMLVNNVSSEPLVARE